MGQASFVEAFLRPDVGVNRRLERIDGKRPPDAAAILA